MHTKGVPKLRKINFVNRVHKPLVVFYLFKTSSCARFVLDSDRPVLLHGQVGVAETLGAAEDEGRLVLKAAHKVEGLAALATLAAGTFQLAVAAFLRFCHVNA